LTHEVLLPITLLFPWYPSGHYGEIGTLFRRKYKSELMLHLQVWVSWSGRQAIPRYGKENGPSGGGLRPCNTLGVPKIGQGVGAA
jgi:hypothetical protein